MRRPGRYEIDSRKMKTFLKVFVVPRKDSAYSIKSVILCAIPYANCPIKMIKMSEASPKWLSTTIPLKRQIKGVKVTQKFFLSHPTNFFDMYEAIARDRIFKQSLEVNI